MRGDIPLGSLENGFLEGASSIPSHPHRAFMRFALREAVRGFHEGEVPVGAVIVLDGRVIASAHNGCERLCDPTAHAEILALRRACEAVGNYRLNGAKMYVTVEPCLMCAGAIHLARLKEVIYGCREPKGGAFGSLYSVHLDGRLNHKVDVVGGVLEEESTALMRAFFRKLRRSKDGLQGEKRHRLG